MQFGVFDNRRRHHSQEISRLTSGAARSFSCWVGKLFRNPLAIVLLVWGFLFLILSVTLACAQDAGRAVNSRVTAERAVCGKKAEAVEIFSAGEDLVIAPRASAVKVSSRRRAIAVGRRARR